MAFPDTRWTLILKSRERPELRKKALAELLHTYWPPLYAFLRQKGLAREAAEDALQGFAVQLLERDVLAKLDPGRGRLRGFLKTALSNHVAHDRDREHADRRGGGQRPLSIDAALADRIAADPADGPERAFERAWAQQVMSHATERLAAEHRSGARAGPWEVVAAYFSGGTTEPYPVLAQRHGLSVPQIKSLLHRARGRFRQLLEDEVAQTVAEPGEPREIDAEIEELLRAL